MPASGSNREKTRGTPVVRLKRAEKLRCPVSIERNVDNERRSDDPAAIHRDSQRIRFHLRARPWDVRPPNRTPRQRKTPVVRRDPLYETALPREQSPDAVPYASGNIQINSQTTFTERNVLFGHNGSGKSTMWYEHIVDNIQIPLINADRMMLSILPEKTRRVN